MCLRGNDLIFGNSSAYVQIQFTNCITHFLVSLVNQLQRKKNKNLPLCRWTCQYLHGFLLSLCHVLFVLRNVFLLKSFFPDINIDPHFSEHGDTSYSVFSHLFLLTELQFCSVAIGPGKTPYLAASFVANGCHMPYQVELYVIFIYVYKCSG